jgi:hypothetical protein
VYSNKAAMPYAKGEGALHMVADLVSANYGWLWSPDWKEEAQVLFKVGKSCEGYFMAENILNQAAKAIDILKKHYPDQAPTQPSFEVEGPCLIANSIFNA